ncbi:GPW/gp25 family protein [Sphingomonas sp. VDB2]|uniref:GPW/gp25 family protein n=1 Tax=Sphingomonas sp. VDB2 TaxID=3228751 RepID=UPI003A8010CA
MTGMARQSGATLDGVDHIIQSVSDILSTPIGTVVGLREYGSLVPALIDQPMTRPNLLRIFAASATALARWEDRIRVRRIGLVAGDRPGAGIIAIEAQRTETGATASLARLLVPLNR